MAIKNSHMTEKNECTQDDRCNREFSRRTVVIHLVEERGLENACMAFCTWNKTLKGNTPVYHTCATSIDSSIFFVFKKFSFCIFGGWKHKGSKTDASSLSKTHYCWLTCLVTVVSSKV